MTPPRPPPPPPPPPPSPRHRARARAAGPVRESAPRPHRPPGGLPGRAGRSRPQDGAGTEAPRTPPRSTGRLLYGVNPVLEALRAGREVFEAYALEGSRAARGALHELRRRGVTVVTRDRHELSTMCGSSHHQGLLARVEPIPNGSLSGLVRDRPSEPLLVLVLDGIQDPQNLGAIYRSADATGVDLVFVPAHEAASPQLPSVARASAGAVEHVPTVVVGQLARPLEELSRHGFRILGLVQDGQVDLDQVEPAGRMALILGSEGAGLSRVCRERLGGTVRIPMCGRLDSLNAASAAAIALYRLRQRMGCGSSRPDPS